MITRLLALLLALALPMPAWAGKLYMDPSLAAYPATGYAVQTTVPDGSPLGGPTSTCIAYPTTGTAAFFPAVYPIDGPARNTTGFTASVTFHKLTTGSTGTLCLLAGVGLLSGGSAPAQIAPFDNANRYVFGLPRLLHHQAQAGTAYTATDQGTPATGILNHATTTTAFGPGWEDSCTGPGTPFGCCTAAAGGTHADTGCFQVGREFLDAQLQFVVSRFAGPWDSCTDGSTASWCVDYLVVTY